MNEETQESQARRKVVKLWCVLVGKAGDAFPVVIDVNETVGDLKEAIKGKNEDITCPARQLQLYLAKKGGAWLQSSSEDVKKLKKGEKTATIEELTLKDKVLDVQDDIADLLEGMAPLAKKHIHVLVVDPEDAASTVKQSVLGKRKLADIRDSFPAPSSFARFRGKDCWKDVLKALHGQIDCHRITMDYDSLPITLMHPVFAEFVENCRSLLVDKESCEFANVLRQSMIEDYENEKEMAEVARNILGAFLNIDLVIINVKGSESDGSCRINGQLIMNLEMKTHQGGGCDPSLQNLAYFVKHLPNEISRQLPCLLLDISGPVFGVYGVMNTDDAHIICEPLCPVFPLHDVQNVLIRPGLPRVCSALRVATERLKAIANNDVENERKLSTFPYKNTVQMVDGATVKLHYMERVARYVFLVEFTLADGSVCKAIAKFAREYGREVHEYCASKGFAPRLLAYEVLPANWIFVLMENVRMESISKMNRIQRIQQLQIIQQYLRDGGFVHGDLRHTNVALDQDQNRVVVIDFDWSGRHGVDRYPSDMNPEIAWPSGASTGQLLSFDHDAFWISQLRQEYC